MHYLDFRSDTVTKPGAAMRRAMAEAEVGDDVYGDDPTVNRLEAVAAERLGKEAAIFAPSGTQTNLIALLTHCGRGDEYIVGQDGHTYKYEGGGAAVFGSIVPQPIEYEADGSLDLDKVAAKIKPDNIHFARTRLFCLENTNWNRVLSMDYQRRATEFARGRGLATHLDGARIFNAEVKLGIEAAAIAAMYDTVSVCLSKGLGAPVGSVLVGPRDFITKARRWRKVLGGGMRQAGILAAAGLYALANNVQRLAEDHAHAASITAGLSALPDVDLIPYSGETNMVFFRLRRAKPGDLGDFLKSRGVLVTPGATTRIVTHLDVDATACAKLVEEVGNFFGQAK